MKIYINYTKDPCIEVQINDDKDHNDKSYFDFMWKHAKKIKI